MSQLPVNRTSALSKIMETEFNKEDVLTVFETMAARLEALDGMIYWGDEIEMIKEALIKAGY